MIRQLSSVGLCWALALLAPQRAGAHAFEDVFATDARFKALAGAGTAIADGPAAVFFNPAGLTRRSGIQLSTGFDIVAGQLYSRPKPPLAVTNEALAVTSVGLAGELWPKRVFAGMLFSQSLDSQLSLMQSTPHSTPVFALYGDRLEVLSLLAAVAARIFDSLSCGIGASILGGSQINLVLDISALSQEELALRFSYDMKMAVALIGGLSWAPLSTLRVGLTYRMALYHKLDVNNATILDVMGVEGVMHLLFQGAMWYTPHQVSLGVAYRLWDRVDLTADLTWYHWSAYPGPFVNGKILDSPAGALLTEPAPYLAEFSDIVVPRFGVAVPIGSRWVARAGYGYHATPAPPAAGPTNVLGSAKHVLALGGGVEILQRPRWPVTLRVDVSAAFHLHSAASRSDGTLEWGGSVFNGAGTLTLGL